MWERLLGNFRLELSFGSFRLGSIAWECSLSILWLGLAGWLGLLGWSGLAGQAELAWAGCLAGLGWAGLAGLSGQVLWMFQIHCKNMVCEFHFQKHYVLPWFNDVKKHSFHIVLFGVF